MVSSYMKPFCAFVLVQKLTAHFCLHKYSHTLILLRVQKHYHIPKKLLFQLQICLKVMMNLSDPNHPKEIQDSCQFGRFPIFGWWIRNVVNRCQRWIDEECASVQSNECSRYCSWRNFSCLQKIQGSWPSEKKDIWIEVVSIVSFTLCYQQEEVFGSLQGEINDSHDDYNDKDSRIIFQVPIIANSFNTFCLGRWYRMSSFQYAFLTINIYKLFESVTNATKEKTHNYIMKFENVIFHYDKFQTDDIIYPLYCA